MLNDLPKMTGPMLDRMEASAAEKAPHLLPIVNAIRNHGAGFLVVPQRATDLERGIALLARPFIVLVGDDADGALGPEQYDRVALERLIGMADGVAIISSAPPEEAYAGIAKMTMVDCNGLIIETQPEQEIAWTNLVRAVRPCMPILLCTPKAPRQ